MKRPLRIGIIGGGQLARMLSLAAKKLGFYVTITDPTPHSPAGQVADRQIVGGYKDEKTTQKLASLSDVVTIDAEFINEKVLQKLENEGKIICPAPQTIEIIKDKLRQKKFLKTHKIPTAEFMEVKTKSDIENAIKKFGLPILLKARFDAYDGKGNFVIKNRADIKEGLEKLKDRKLYAEGFVPFVKELAIMVARARDGEIKSYPVVQTLHKDNICDSVIAPAAISEKARRNVNNITMQTIQQLRGLGIFGIEMFLTKDDNVLVNEIAPRVHNSGHYTIEGSTTSQFEQHIRAITGMPLGKTGLVAKAVVMKNILGTRNGPGGAQGLEKALKIPGVSVHMYGKHESRIGRKMGHITAVGDNINVCLQKANQARNMIVI